MPWDEVKYDSDVEVRNTCATLLNDAVPGNSMPLVDLNNLLNPVDQGGSNGYKENPPTGANPIRPVFRLYAYTDANHDITITVAFSKTIKRTGGPTISDPESVPTRRWWTINLGCQQKAGGPSIYNEVKNICLDFYKNELGDIDGHRQYLYILDNADRAPEPTIYKADEVLQELFEDAANDPRLTVIKHPNEPAYAAFVEIPGLNILSVLQIVYT